MEFLVRIEVTGESTVAPERWEALLAAEAEEGRRRLEVGTLRRIWRIPGKLANYSLYDVADATALHELLTSLPLHPWMSIEVVALAQHPLEGLR